MNFWTNLDTPLAFSAFFFALLVVFVNGWTDAPNSIFSLVNSGTTTPTRSFVLSGIFNFLGVLISSIFTTKVSKTIFSFAIFQGEHQAYLVAISCFIVIFLFGAGFAFLGLPSSESHALVFSLIGALFASGNRGNITKNVVLTIFYIVISCILALILSFITIKLLPGKSKSYRKTLFFSCAALSFMHGWQDGQKFLAILAFVICVDMQRRLPLSLILLVSLVMLLGTLLGGKRILKTLSDSSPINDCKSSFAEDVGAFLTIFACSLFGMPISTGNVKSLSIIGVSLAANKKIDKKTTAKILLSSVVTLPICFLGGCLIYKLLYAIL